MYKKQVVLALIGMLLFTACVSKTIESPILPEVGPQSTEGKVLYRTMDYKTKALEEDIPEWVYRYEGEGIPGIERLSEYQHKYVFVAKNTGTNFNALNQWTAGFRVTHDFARLVASRLQARLTSAAALYPDDEYGGFFELAIKAAFDAVYYGAVKETDFWLLKEYYKEEDGVTVDRETYDFLILVSVDKSRLQSQLQQILSNLTPTRPPTKDQTSAINRIKANLFNTF
ncbi:MAG: hypothetical protein LBU17_08545 [Treponema sp.]|jgi:hypothetical protein|nr:hypothetical protein [Treponema sp.]